MNLKSFHMSVQGAGHIKRGKECQDASKGFYDGRCAYVVVCDGHGGDDYVRSGKGAEIASEIAAEKIENFIARIDAISFLKSPDKYLRILEENLIKTWIERVHEDYAQNPFTPEEIKSVSERMRQRCSENRRMEVAYGTTLLAIAMTEDYCFGIQIGDGKCVGIRGDTFRQPIPDNPKCFLNSTTSICDRNALSEFQHFYTRNTRKLPAAIFIGSDGIDNCFQNDEQLYALYGTILHAFATTEFETAESQLKKYLPRLSAKGSQDDVSIAAIFDMDRIGSLPIVENFAANRERKVQEENTPATVSHAASMPNDEKTAKSHIATEGGSALISADGSNPSLTVGEDKGTGTEDEKTPIIKADGKLPYDGDVGIGLRTSADGESGLSSAECTEKYNFFETVRIFKGNDVISSGYVDEQRI